MPGQGCPRGPLCLLRNQLSPALWLGEASRLALIAVLVIVGLLVQSSKVHGQQNQFDDDLLQSGSVQREGFGSRRTSVFSTRRSDRRGLRRRQPGLSFARRRMFTLQRAESGQVVEHPQLAEVIKSRDSLRLLEGDWQAMAFERDTAGLFQANGRLADHHFNDVPHATFGNLESLPLAVRQGQADQKLYFYLANASPWRLRVRMQLPEGASGQAAKNIKSLSKDKFSLASNADGGKVLSIDLGPYGLIGGSTSELATIESYTFEYLDDVASDMRKRVFALQVKLQQAQQAGALRILSNPKFLASESETASRGPIDGWEIGQQAPTRFQLFHSAGNQKNNVQQQVAKQASESADANERQLETHLQVRSFADEVTWIRSHPITPTETGRLSISVWLRLNQNSNAKAEAGKVPEVRMAIDGQTLTDDYYRFGVVAREPADSLKTLGTHWKRFAVHFEDLPCSLIDLRIGFDIVGEGVVEIGQVELFDRWFDNGDAKKITQLLASADAMLRHPAQFDRCRRLLAEPWAVFLDDYFLLKPIPKSAQQPVPMFRPKVAQADLTDPQTTKRNDGKSKVNQSSKVEQSLNR